MTTPKTITYIVVGSLALMSIVYLGTLSYCVISNNSPGGDIMRSFEAAGIYVLGALTGILVNTRTQPPSDKEKHDA